LSVLAAPNRNDIPPQGSLSYQIDQNLSISGAVDSQGTWQSQLQLFFRF
jgi:translocation and assembly module TamB